MGALLDYVIIGSVMSSVFGAASVIAVRFLNNITEKNKSRLLFWSLVSPYAAMIIFSFASFFAGGLNAAGILVSGISTGFIETVFIVWLIIALILIIKLITGYIIFIRSLHRTRGFLYKKGKISVYNVNMRGTPFAAGLVMPCVYFSQSVLDRSCDSETEMMLAHETAHIKNCDLHKKFILSLLECVNWFNPFYHLIKQTAVLRMEYACDEAVAERLSLEDRKKYALALLKSAESGSLAPNLPTAGFSIEAENLQRRIKTLMKKQNKQSLMSGIAVKIIVTAMIMSSLSVCACAVSYSLSENAEAEGNLICSEPGNVNIYQRGDGSLFAVIRGYHIELNGYYVDKYGYLGYDDLITGGKNYAVSLDCDIAAKSYSITTSCDAAQAVKIDLSDDVMVSEPSPALVLDGELIYTQSDGVEFYRKSDNSIYFIIDGKATTISNSYEEMYFIDDEGYISSFSSGSGKRVYLEHITNIETGWFSSGSSVNKQDAINVIKEGAK